MIDLETQIYILSPIEVTTTCYPLIITIFTFRVAPLVGRCASPLGLVPLNQSFYTHEEPYKTLTIRVIGLRWILHGNCIFKTLCLLGNLPYWSITTSDVLVK